MYVSGGLAVAPVWHRRKPWLEPLYTWRVHRVLPVLLLFPAIASCLRAGFGLAPNDDASLSRDDRGVSPSIDSPWLEYALLRFEQSWRTTRALGWAWQCSGSIADFSRYELCIAESPTAVASAGANCLSPADDPGLGQLECGGGDLWHPGVTLGLEPDREYFAQVRVYDQAGTQYASPILSNRTLAPPPTRVVVFSEMEDSNSNYWFNQLVPGEQNPAQGSRGLRFEATDDSYQQLHVGGFAGELSFAGLDQLRFETAFLEYYIDAPQAAQTCVYLYDGSTIAYDFCPPAGYLAVDGRTGFQRVQAPLMRFKQASTGVALTEDTLQQMNSVTFGSTWGAGPVDVDEIAFWY